MILPKLKNKAELDALPTYKGVMEYRYTILAAQMPEEDYPVRYVKELSLYIDMRFKDIYFDRLNEWRKALNKKKGDKLTLDSYKLIFSLGDGSNEFIHKFFTDMRTVQLDEMQYIK